MNYLNKITIKNLKLNKKRTIVTIIGIVLSVALIATISSILVSFHKSLITVEKVQNGNFHYAFMNVPESDIKYFKENRNFEEVSITKSLGYATLENCRNSLKPYAYFIAFDESALNNIGIELLEGKLPKNDSEVLIPEHLMESGRINYDIGDTIEFAIGQRTIDGTKLNQSDSYNGDSETITNSFNKSYKIVGIIKRPIFSLEDYNSPGFTFITLLNNNNYANEVDIYTRYTNKALKNELNITADILGGDSKLLEYMYPTETIRYTDEEKENFDSQIKQLKYIPAKNTFLVQLESKSFLEGEFKLIGYAVIVLIVIISISSIFCIRNSFNISLTEKTKQNGMLNTIGATSKQIKKTIYHEALILSLISIPIGIIVSIIISYSIVLLCNNLALNFLGFNLQYSFSYLSLIVAIIPGFIIVFLSSWQSAHFASKISPLEALVNSEQIKISKNELKTPNFIQKYFGIGGTISYKNLQRSRKKYLSTTIILILSVAIFISLSTFLQITLNNISSEFQKDEYNIAISFNYNKDNDITEALNSLLASEYVKNYSIVSDANLWQDNREVKFSKEYFKYFPDCQKEQKVIQNGVEILYNPHSGINIYKVGDYSYKKYLKSLNLSYDDMKYKGILMNYDKMWVTEDSHEIQKIISHFSYQPGDILSWRTSEHDQKQYPGVVPDTIDIEIDHITDKLPFGLNGEFKYSSSIVVSDEYFDQLFPYLKDEYYVWTYLDVTNPLKFHEEIEKKLVNYSYSIENYEKEVRDKKNLYTLLAFFIYGFIFILSIIGLTSIINTITTNMKLRSREFAMLKSIGMTSSEFNRMISLESIFYGLKSLIIGIPLGIFISYYFIFYKFAMANLSSSVYQFPTKAIFISIIGVFILVMVIMRYSISIINKQNTIETIRNENI